MSSEGQEATDIAPGIEPGNVVVSANGSRVEIRKDGSVAVFTNRNIDAYGSGAVYQHPPPDDKKSPQSQLIEPRPGDRMVDGTIFAGISPETGKPMYTTASDGPLTVQWKAAMEYAKQLDAHGHQDWRLPTKTELNVLFNNRAAIGGFDLNGPQHYSGWYWSSVEPDEAVYAWAQCLSNGESTWRPEYYELSVRCIR